MRYLHYKLADGSVVKTMDEAKASGQRYTEYMENIPYQSSGSTPIRELALKMWGVANSDTIDAVKYAISQGNVPNMAIA